MEKQLTQEEIKAALLAALLDYDSIKKTRRLAAVKKTLRGTMVATLIGSSGLMAANPGRSPSQSKAAAIMLANTQPSAALVEKPLATKKSKFIPGVAHFGFSQHELSHSQEFRLLEIIQQLPEDSEVTLIGRTDYKGTRRFNEKLGKFRAQAVADFFAQHNIKVVSVSHKQSNAVAEAWMMRRVDMIVASSAENFLLKTSPSTQTAKIPLASRQVSLAEIAKIPTVSHPKPEIAPAPIAKVPGNTNRFPIIDDESNLSELTSMAPVKPAKGMRQKIRGASYFMVNGHELSWIQKERLMQLAKQLPKDAELTIIGRTEANGAEIQTMELGLLRARAVATFVSYFGIKVNAVGSKESSNGFSGWGARRVDIIVDSKPTSRVIYLPPQLVPESQSSGMEVKISTDMTDLPTKPSTQTVRKRTPYLYYVE